MNFRAGWIVAVFVVVLTPCFGQFDNTRLSEDSARTSAPDISVAINPKNPLIVIAAAGQDHIFRSEDGGKSWKRGNVKSMYGFHGSPVVVCDNKGAFYLFHQSDPAGKGTESESCMESLVCHVSPDGGRTWDEGTAFGTIAGKDLGRPFVQFDSKGNLWAIWTQFDKYGSQDSTCHSVIVGSSSSNGKKWSAPVVLSQVHGTCADDRNTVAGATLALSEDKRLFASWANRELIFLDRSFDNGGMWITNDIIMANQSGGWDQKISGHGRCNGLPSLVIDRSKTEQKGMLYLAWSDQRSGEGDSDIWFSRTNNYGDIWTPAMKINGGSDKHHQYLPVMTVDQATSMIYILYYDRRNYDDDRTDVYLAYSRDAGSSFKNIKISTSPFTPAGMNFPGRALSLAAHKGVIIPVWTRVDGKTLTIMSTRVSEEILPK